MKSLIELSWFKYPDNEPDLGDCCLVKLSDGRIKQAVYSDGFGFGILEGGDILTFQTIERMWGSEVIEFATINTNAIEVKND